MSQPTITVGQPSTTILTDANRGSKWTPLLIIGILAFLIFSPLAYAITNAILGPLGLRTTGIGGPTWFGVLLHALIFVLIFKLVIKY